MHIPSSQDGPFRLEMRISHDLLRDPMDNEVWPLFDGTLCPIPCLGDGKLRDTIHQRAKVLRQED
jgi:hypothetical protein